MLTIGQMSKVCGVSVKTLHHYDKIGLLKPQKTDEANGYRYYEDSQIGTMLLIGRLKRYGFPLVDIQRLLTVKDSRELLRQMHQQRFRLERQMEHISITIREMGYHLEEFERTGDIMSYQNNYEVEVVDSGEQVLLTCRATMSVEDFGRYYGKIYEKVAREHLEGRVPRQTEPETGEGGLRQTETEELRQAETESGGLRRSDRETAVSGQRAGETGKDGMDTWQKS